MLSKKPVMNSAVLLKQDLLISDLSLLDILPPDSATFAAKCKQPSPGISQCNQTPPVMQSRKRTKRSFCKNKHVLTTWKILELEFYKYYGTAGFHSLWAEMAWGCSVNKRRNNRIQPKLHSRNRHTQKYGFCTLTGWPMHVPAGARDPVPSCLEHELSSA